MYGLNPKLISRQITLLVEALDLQGVEKRLGGQLSGGMQRRLSIALSLIHDPEIVILDEPEAGLDPQSRIKIRNFLKTLAGSKTVILSTHNMDEADRLSDRLAILDRGHLLTLDSPEALKATAGEGDVLEISFVDLPENLNVDAFSMADRAEILIDQNRLLIRGFDLPNLLPRILSSLDNLKLHPDDIRLRKNTLEDVFVQLTGRRLQE
jgi:ABC-2 type transport system ATP-binding protein